jgi:ketosteroid isomerase-like protein
VTFVRTAAELSRRYIDAHNNHDLDGLLALVADDVDFKRAGEPALRGKAAVRRQYLEDWQGHEHVVVTVKQILQSGQVAAAEIHVDSGAPSNIHYDGIVVHHWSDQERLVRYRLYIDEVTSVETQA